MNEESTQVGVCKEPVEFRFLEIAANGHCFANRFHADAEPAVSRRKLFKGEARHLGDHIVYGRLKRRVSLAGDVVGNLVKSVAD